jgi:hypothetical protein
VERAFQVAAVRSVVGGFFYLRSCFEDAQRELPLQAWDVSEFGQQGRGRLHLLAVVVRQEMFLREDGLPAPGARALPGMAMQIVLVSSVAQKYALMWDPLEDVVVHRSSSTAYLPLVSGGLST